MTQFPSYKKDVHWTGQFFDGRREILHELGRPVNNSSFADFFKFVSKCVHERFCCFFRSTRDFEMRITLSWRLKYSCSIVATALASYIVRFGEQSHNSTVYSQAYEFSLMKNDTTSADEEQAHSER